MRYHFRRSQSNIRKYVYSVKELGGIYRCICISNLVEMFLARDQWWPWRSRNCMPGKIPIEIPFYYFLFVGLHDYITPHNLLSYRENDLIYSLALFGFWSIKFISLLLLSLKEKKKRNNVFIFVKFFIHWIIRILQDESFIFVWINSIQRLIINNEKERSTVCLPVDLSPGKTICYF